MYGLHADRTSQAARLAADELRRALGAMAEAELLELELEHALTLTTPAAVGCVLQLNRTGRGAEDPLVDQMLDVAAALISPATSIWTRDRRLQKMAGELGLEARLP